MSPNPAGNGLTFFTTDVALAQALWRMGMLDLDAVEAIATQALIDGFDSPTLRELAWPDGYRAALWEQMLVELGQARMSEREAFPLVYLEIARRTATGDLEPLVGANRLWRMGHEHHLDCAWSDFLSLSDELDDWYHGDWRVRGTAAPRAPASIHADIVHRAGALHHALSASWPATPWRP